MDESRYGGNRQDDTQFGNFDQQQYESLREQIPEGLMEHLPGYMRDRIEDVIAEADQKNRNIYERVEPDELKTTMNPVLGIVALIIGFGGILIFAMINPIIAILCFGIMFVIFGIGIVTDKNFSFHKNALSTLVLIIGVYVVLITGYLLLAKNIPSLPKIEGKLLIMVIGTGFTGLGVIILILSIIASHYLKKVCSEQVQAVCVYIKEKREYENGHNRIRHAPVFEFQLLGNTYCVAEDYGNGNLPSIGNRCDLFINPNNPKEFYRKGTNSVVGIGIFCVIFILIGGFMCFYA